MSFSSSLSEGRTLENLTTGIAAFFIYAQIAADVRHCYHQTKDNATDKEGNALVWREPLPNPNRKEKKSDNVSQSYRIGVRATSSDSDSKA